jgi:hypothetical protein
MRSFLLLTILGLAAGMVGAEGGPAPATDAERAALRAAMLDVGCLVSAANGDAVLAASGLSDGRAGEIVFEMVGRGLAAPDPNGDLRLIDPACPAPG